MDFLKSPMESRPSRRQRNPSPSVRHHEALSKSSRLTGRLSPPPPHHPSAAVQKALRKLGGDIHDARRRRSLTMAVVAERAFTSRSTLQRVEAGDPAVGMGIYAAVLHALGLLDGLARLADPAVDTVGQALAGEALPQRVRMKSGKG